MIPFCLYYWRKAYNITQNTPNEGKTIGLWPRVGGGEQKKKGSKNKGKDDAFISLEAPFST